MALVKKSDEQVSSLIQLNGHFNNIEKEVAKSDIYYFQDKVISGDTTTTLRSVKNPFVNKREVIVEDNQGIKRITTLISYSNNVVYFLIFPIVLIIFSVILYYFFPLCSL